MENIRYKVLWVDDDLSIVDSTICDADEYGLDLDHYSNWKEAELALKENFTEYSAIILDANCRFSQDEIEDENFISAINPLLQAIFTEKKQDIPWYILSAGTMNNFSGITRAASRSRVQNEWGDMVYLKYAPEGDKQNSHFLFKKIAEIAKDQEANRIRFLYKDVFRYLGAGYMDNKEARDTLLEMLSALHFPEKHREYRCKKHSIGNSVRQVLEHLCRFARDKGLIPNEIVPIDGPILSLKNLFRFLLGYTIEAESEGKKLKVHWEGDVIFPKKEFCHIVMGLVDYTNEGSHTNEAPIEITNTEEENLGWGYGLHVCYIITYLGRYIEEHDNAEVNRNSQKIEWILETTGEKRKNKSDSKDDGLSGIGTIKQDGDIYYCGQYRLDPEIPIKSGKIKIEEFKDNDAADKDRFPFIAVKVTPIVRSY